MKLSKLFIMLLFLWAIFANGNVQASDLIPQTGFETLNQFDESTLAFNFNTITSRIHLNYNSVQKPYKWNSRKDGSSRLMPVASIDYKITNFFYLDAIFSHYELEKLPGGYVTQPEIKKEWFGGLRFRFEF